MTTRVPAKSSPTDESFALSNVERSVKLSDKVTEKLAEGIMNGHFAPGARLPSERELGEQLNVSRTVVREAVRSLAAHGLVTVTAGRGVEVCAEPRKAPVQAMRLMVRGFGELDYSRVHEVRVPIETQTAALAAERRSTASIEKLRAICDRHARQLEKGDLAGAGSTDLAFHDAIAEFADNPLLLEMYHSITEVLKEVRTPAVHSKEVAEAGLEAHRWLLECITAGDVDASRSAMARHLADAEKVWRGS